jgi:glutamate synthase (NADPH/NADH) large chain
MPDAYAEVIAEESREDVRSELPEAATSSPVVSGRAGVVSSDD